MDTTSRLRSRQRVRCGVLVAAAVLISGCTQVTTHSYRLLEAPATTPTDPSAVEILTHPPLRPHVQLGRIVASPNGDVDNAKIEAAIRKEAAKMGADAVIIGFEGELPTGFSIQGLPGSAEARREIGRVVQATAIKYRAEALFPRLRRE